MEAMEAMYHRQDVSWFDLKEVAALPSEINDDLEPLNEGAVRSCSEPLSTLWLCQNSYWKRP